MKTSVPSGFVWDEKATRSRPDLERCCSAAIFAEGRLSDCAYSLRASLAADVVSNAPAPGTALGWTPSSGFGPVPAAAGPVVQRVVEVGEMTAQVEPGSSSGGAGPVAGSGAGGGPDYEEIAEHVYDRIRGRIALELLLDRERMGLLIDG